MDVKLIPRRAKPRNLFGKSNLSASTPFEGNSEIAMDKEDDMKMSEG